MTHRLAGLLAIASLTFATPGPAAAATTTLFDTVDAVEIATASGGAYRIIVTGIRTGEAAPTIHTFDFTGGSYEEGKVRQCERFALLAMSRPGKYRFGIGPGYSSISGCKLTLRTP